MADLMEERSEEKVFAGVGISDSEDAEAAGYEAVSQSIKDMQARGAKKPDFGLVFCSGGKYGKDDRRIRRLVEGAHSVFSEYESQWIGCTTAGEISNYGATSGTCVAMAISSPFVRFGVGVGERISKNPEKAGRRAASDAWDNIADLSVHPALRYLVTESWKTSDLVKMRPYAMITLIAGSTKTTPSQETKVLNGVLEVTGPSVSIIGGSAADDLIGNGNYQFCNGKVYEDSIVCAAILSDLKFANAFSHGFKPTDKWVMVTKSNGPIIQELNKKPAAEEYAKLVGVTLKEFKDTQSNVARVYPLGFRDAITGIYWLVVPGPILSDNAIILAGINVPEGSVLRIMKGTIQNVLYSTKDVTKAIREEIEEVELAIISDCSMRLKILGEKVREEIETIMKKSLKNKPFIGFYTYGEQISAPWYGARHCNQTITAMGFSNELIAEK